MILFPLILIALVVIGVVFQEFRELFLPFAIAVLFSILFHPIVSNMNQRKIPFIFSLFTVLIILALTMLILGSIFYSSALPLIQDLPTYQYRLDQIVNNVVKGLSELIGTLGLKTEHIDSRTLLGVTTVTAEVLSSTLATFFAFLGNVALVLLFMLFMLAGTGELNTKVKRAYPSDVAKTITTAFSNIGMQVRRYLLIRILLSGITGILSLLVLWILGVKFPFFWGLLTFLLVFIPTLGSILAVGLPFIFTLLQFDEFTRPLLALSLLSTIHMIMGNVVQPKLMAKSLNLSPLLIIVALIFWGIMWGPWGMILAIPLTTTIKIIFENIEPLQPVAVLMSAGSDN